MNNEQFFWYMFSQWAVAAGTIVVAIVLMALSDEGESNELKLEIAWDGVWSEDSDVIVRHMVVKQLNGRTDR